MTKIIIYTDGACLGNPGVGGYGAVIINDGKIEKISGGEKYTTNNKMEILGAINGLEYIVTPSEILLTTDSKYLMNGATIWIHNWKKNRWKTKKGEDVKNKDLWERLDVQCYKHKIKWLWVKGHSGNKYNELADGLAIEGYTKFI